MCREKLVVHNMCELDKLACHKITITIYKVKLLVTS